MIAVDTNILVYAHRRETAEHAVASAHVRDLAQGSDRWAIPWPCVYEFTSVVTNRRIWGAAASKPAQAWAQVRAWTASPSAVLIGETEGFLEILEPLLNRPRVVGPVAHDARVAAICLAHGVRSLWTRDRDFGLFPELDLHDPFRE